MLAYIVFRVLHSIPVLLVVSLTAFILVALLPGDAGDAMAAVGAEYYNPAAIQQLREDFGLDRPLPERYLRWMSSILQGNFGRSLRTNEPLTEVMASRLPPTVALALGGLVSGVLMGVILGVLAALSYGSWVDRTLTVIGTLGLSVPNFWLGLMLLVVFTQWFRLLPAFGYVPLEAGLGEYLSHMVLPWLTLGTSLMAEIMRQTRSSMLDVLGQDFIRTARSKGLSDRIVKWNHALKNALIPVATLTGLSLGRLLGGVVVIEAVFSIPGLGSLAVAAFGSRDFAVLQATILFAALATLTASLLADLMYAYLDPRIRYG